jgi:hypothetical protein
LVHPVYVALQRKKLKSGDARAFAGETGWKRPQKQESFIFQGCTRHSNALYDGHMQALRNHPTANRNAFLLGAPN